MKNKKRLWWSFGVIGLIGAIYASLVYAQAVRSPFRSTKIGATDFVDFAFTGPPNFPFGATGITATISDLTITAVADPNATVGGGAVILNDNTELQTYDGAGTAPGDFKGNLTVDLDAVCDSTCTGGNPDNGTTYYVYIDKALVTAPITRDDGQVVRGIRTTDFAVSTNTSLNKGRHIPIAFVRTATAGNLWSGAGSSFGNLAFKRGADATVTVNSIRYSNTDTVTTLGTTGTLTHNMAVPVDDQEWIALVSISGGDDVQLDNGWITDTDENSVDYDFTGLAGADVVTLHLRDLATTPLNVPISEFERLYTSLPSFPITHGLGELPASATLKQEGQTAAGEWTTLDFDSFCDMNETDFDCAGFTTIDATHRLIITLSKAAIAAGMDEASFTVNGFVNDGAQTFAGPKSFKIDADVLTTAPADTVALFSSGDSGGDHAALTVLSNGTGGDGESTIYLADHLNTTRTSIQGGRDGFLRFSVETQGDALIIENDGDVVINEDDLMIGTSTKAPFAIISVEGDGVSANGASINLRTDASGTTDLFGQIEFGNPTDSSTAVIRGQADGAADAGKLIFFTEATGVAAETAMVIDSNQKTQLIVHDDGDCDSDVTGGNVCSDSVDTALTIAASTNCAVCSIGGNPIVMRVGNVVHVSFRAEVDPTAANTFTEFDITAFPFSPTTPFVAGDASGVCVGLCPSGTAHDSFQCVNNVNDLSCNSGTICGTGNRQVHCEITYRL